MQVAVRNAQAEALARQKWQEYHESRTLEEIDAMTGLEFEEFLARFLLRIGFSNVEMTAVNDQGGDLLCESSDGDRVVIQAKRWTAKVGNSVVQEVLGAMLHYACNRGIVITNSRFTQAAVDLARKDARIALYDREWLDQRLREQSPSRVPEFDWDEYKRVLVDSHLLKRRQ